MQWTTFSITFSLPLGPTHLGYEVLFRGVQRPGREADQSLSFNAHVKNEWSYTSAPPTCMPCTGPTLLLRFARGAKILGTRSPPQLNFVRRSINASGSSVWKLYHVTILAPIIYKTVSRFVTNCGPLHFTVIGHLTRHVAARVWDCLLEWRGRRGAAIDSCQIRSELLERWLRPVWHL